MSVKVIGNADYAALYNSVTMTAFGPVFGEDDRHALDATEVAEVFLAWLRADARQLNARGTLCERKADFLWWLSGEPVRTGVDDLRQAARGLYYCESCGEWLDGAQFDPGRRECRACVIEGARCGAADAERDEA